MPDLGKYTVEVSMAYGVSLILIFLLVGVSILQARRARRALLEIEERRKSDG
ncbi:heme exporter protein CcmD [Cochlodiniinecator piscidefendens]|uniref:heme exporter protein CcmD n=1 Tax=Cochlodiniinecator piscidefendens TaxID=2715756 RepID=UPI002F403BB3